MTPNHEPQPGPAEPWQQPGQGYAAQPYGQPAPPPGAVPPYGAPVAPYGQPMPYGQPYGYPYPAPQRTNGMAIASMVLGILWIYWVGSILALVFGYVARSQIRERREAGDGMAIAGIVLGWVGIGILVLVLVIGVAASSRTF